MDFTLLSQINEAYRHGVYAEETLSEEELVSIEEWVEALIEEGYDLDQYSDEELYAAYLVEMNQATLERIANQAARESTKKKPKGKKVKLSHGMREELDLYDIVSEYLVSEGFCDSYEDADVIMANMSEEWRESIMEEVLDERNRGEVGMSDREVSRSRNLGLRNPKMSSSSFGDHGSQKPIQKYHARKGQIRTAEHRASRGTRGDLGRVSGTGAMSRYSANKEHEDGYPSIVHRGSGPF